jgi:hypothetical protein
MRFVRALVVIGTRTNGRLLRHLKTFDRKLHSDVGGQVALYTTARSDVAADGFQAQRYERPEFQAQRYERPH